MFEHAPFSDRLIRRHDPAISPYTHDSVLTAVPDAVFRPSTVMEIREVMQYCHAEKIPVTCCGARTSQTGGSITDTGLLLSLEKLSGIVDIDTDAQMVTVRPGMILGEMQRAVEEAGLYYPPSPTSRHECTVGATLITNATGDTTFTYGTTRHYVQEITIVTANGNLRTLQRRNPPPVESKNKAGYFLGGEEIDLIVGSEGTLGIVVETRLKLIGGVPQFMTFMIPFASNMDALRFIASHNKYDALSPRTMEYVDEAASYIMRTHPSLPKMPEDARAFVICQQEFVGGDEDNHLENWFAALRTGLHENIRPCLDHVIVARTTAEQDRIAAWRHHIPAVILERHLELLKNDGGKVGTDWWVPLPRMLETMAWLYERSDMLGVPYIAFGHLGDGHPHVNYLTRNPEEKAKATALVIASCKRAVAMGGGVAGEHGLGKIKRDLLAIQHPKAVIDRMITVKHAWDTHWILGRGNIFVEELIP